MKVSILTYNIPHRKTHDLVFALMANGIRDIRLIAIPFKERKIHQPLFRHRPAVMHYIPVEDFCGNLGLTLVRIKDYKELLSVDCGNAILIGGAGIIPRHVTDELKIINAHPGYIPMVRGLDSFKWSIMEGHPIGVTIHVITEDIDNGPILERGIINIGVTDTFHSVATRLYEMEINMLAGSIHINKYIQPDNDDFTGPVRKRMNHFKEIEMMKRFQFNTTHFV